MKDSLCCLCTLWQRSVHTLDISAADEELDPWGPNEDEILRADIVAVMAAWGNNSIEDDGDDDDEVSVMNLDEEEEMDIGLINTLEVVDLADAYRGIGAGEDDIDFVDNTQF